MTADDICKPVGREVARGYPEAGEQPATGYPSGATETGWRGRGRGRGRKPGALKETEAGITMKLKCGTFTATFFLACIAALELEQVVLEEI
jgi:Domain of unknown function (DUF6471)